MSGCCRELEGERNKEDCCRELEMEKTAIVRRREEESTAACCGEGLSPSIQGKRTTMEELSYCWSELGTKRRLLALHTRGKVVVVDMEDKGGRRSYSAGCRWCSRPRRKRMMLLELQGWREGTADLLAGP